METFIFANGFQIDRIGNALEVQPGSTIYLQDNTPLRVLSVEVANDIQTIDVEFLVEQ